MNTLAGVFARRTGIVDQRLTQRLMGGLQPFGPDGPQVITRPLVSIVHLSFTVDHPFRESAGPYIDRSGNIMCLSGRIDNRNDILETLELAPATPDTGILLALYAQGGIKAFAQVIGEFTAVIWDASCEKLCLVADPLGRRPLYYHLSPDQLVWSSRPRVLADCLSSATELNLEYLANFILNKKSESSPYRGTVPVGAGVALIVAADSVETIKYWSPDPPKSITYKSDEEYEDHFRSLFYEAVRCRIQTAGPYFCELSGGLDSSSIVAVARELERRETRNHLRTVSYTFPSSLDADESVYMREMTAVTNSSHWELSDEQWPIFSQLPGDLKPDFPTGDLAFFSRHQRLLEIMSGLGARMILSGIGGDQLFWSSPHVLLPVLDAIAGGHLGQVLRHARACAEVASSHFCVPLFLGLWWSVRYRGSLYPLDSERRIADWFDPHFISQSGANEPVRAATYNPACDVPSRAYQHLLVERTMRDYALDRNLGAPVEMRYPYLDQRLIQFALALPFEQCVRPRETRSIVRRSLRNVLPHKISYRTTKAGPTEPWLRALIRNWPRVSSARQKLLVEELGIVDASRFRAALAHVRCGLVAEPRQLVSTLCLELWLRSIYCEDNLPKSQAQAASLRSPTNVNARKEKAHAYTTALQ